jgi:hypothetical protein
MYNLEVVTPLADTETVMTTCTSTSWELKSKVEVIVTPG